MREQIELLDYSAFNYEKETLTLVCDGACSQNGTWTGGWANLIVTPSNKAKLTYSALPKTTNNVMELFAILESLEKIYKWEISRGKKFEHLNVISDSGYCVFPFIRYNWYDKKFIPKKFEKETKNLELWLSTFELYDYFKDRISFTHVIGTHPEKGRCDPNPVYAHYNKIVNDFAVRARVEYDQQPYTEKRGVIIK